MLIGLMVLQAITLLVVVALLLRRQGPASDPALVEHLKRLEVKNETLEATLHRSLADARREAAETAIRAQEAGAASAAQLRTEVMDSIVRLGTTLSNGLEGFRTDNKTSATELRLAVQQQMDAVQRRLLEFAEASQQQATGLRESLNARMTDLMTGNAQHLDKLNRDNSAKLEEMRQTVDEKLHATLQSRLTESFGQVTTHLGEVQKGLGEMKELATGVSDLKKVFSNVKSRGVVGEFMLGQLMEQIFSPEQYLKNARIKRNTLETVEFALKVPTGNDESAMLAIDSKFPQGDWERLEHAYDHGSAEEIATAGKAFERAIRTQADSICKKYIDEPSTLPYAVMFLPTEGLYAEVLRRPGLVTDLQQECRVMVAGPSTFLHMMANFRMGFRTIAIQKKGGEVWKVLGSAKKEFEKFGGLMDKVQKQVGAVQNTLQEIGSKTTTINRTLKNVESEVEEISSGEKATVLEMEELAAIAPLLAATEE